MAKLAFIVQTEPYKFEAVDTLLKLVEAANAANHEILGVFFYGSGVYGLQKHIDPGSTVRNLSKKIKENLADKGIALIGCRTWLSTDGMWEENRIENVRDEGLGSLTEMIAEADKVITFGPGV
ncbi:MAG: DsrE/DsrF/TusD sulfur relay family protein [Candidatus Thorarchaeota archaeon]